MTPQGRISLSALTLAAAIALMPAGFAQAPSPPPAQTDQDHSAHHPGTNGEAAHGPSRTKKQSGGTSTGTMGQRGQGAMMDGDMKKMMSMMRGMMTMMSARSGMMASNIEGRIASLKTELKVTDTQLPQWNSFADALRAAAKSMNQANQSMMQSDGAATLPARLDSQSKMLVAHLASLKALTEALNPLYASFSDEQKKVADGLMVGPMGMM